MSVKVTKKKLLFFSFVVPFFLLVAVFAALKIAPFGDRGLLFSDAACYSISDLISFRNQVEGNKSILYSFSNSLGGNNTLSLPFLLYPYSWLMLLAGWDHIELCFAFAVILVTCFYGVSMMLLLCDILNPKASHLIFTTCYALMGFNVVYNYSIVFFGGPLFLPLMVLGLRKIFRGESGHMYAISLAYCIATLIQFGLILCETSVVFFIAKQVLAESIDRKKVSLRYIFYSLAGGLVPAVFWVTNILALAGGRASQNSLEDFTFNENAPILTMFSRLFSGAASTAQIQNGLPAIFCGILTVFLVIVYFLDKENPKKIRIVFGVILSLLLLTFYIRFFSTIVHGSHTNWFNFRNSFVFSFVLIIIAACELERIGEIEEKVIWKALLILVISTLLIFFRSYEFISGGNVVLDLALLAIMLTGVLFFRRHPERASLTTLSMLLLVCTCLQLYINYYVSMQSIYTGEWKIYSVPEYQQMINKKLPMIQALSTYDTSFYRMEDEFTITGARIGNDAEYFNYNGLGRTNLSVDKSIALNEAKFGISFAREMMCCYDEGMPAAMESLLGLKYLISPRDLATEKNYNLRVNGIYEDVGAIYENPNVLSIAMLSDPAISKVDISDEKDVFKIQNIVWKGLTGGKKDMFTEEEDVKLSMHNPTDSISLDKEELLKLPDKTANLKAKDEDSKEASEEESQSANSTDKKTSTELNPEDYMYSPYIEYEFVAKKTGPIYLYDSAAFVEGEGSLEDILQYVGYFHEGDKVVGRLLFGYTLNTEVFVATGQGLKFAYADMDTLAEYAQFINAKEATIEKIKEHHLIGTVNAAEAQRLLFTIPYQKGWTLLVDGKEAKIDKTCDLFMSTEVTAGEHVYELKFWPPGMTIGIIISIIGLVLLVCLCGYDLRHRITVDTEELR